MFQVTEQKVGKGRKLVITVDIDENPKPSASGKTGIVASSHGNQPTTVMVQGKPVIVGFNAYTKS